MKAPQWLRFNKGSHSVVAAAEEETESTQKLNLLYSSSHSSCRDSRTNGIVNVSGGQKFSVVGEAFVHLIRSRASHSLFLYLQCCPQSSVFRVTHTFKDWTYRIPLVNKMTNMQQLCVFSDTSSPRSSQVTRTCCKSLTSCFSASRLSVMSEARWFEKDERQNKRLWEEVGSGNSFLSEMESYILQSYVLPTGSSNIRLFPMWHLNWRHEKKKKKKKKKPRSTDNGFFRADTDY